MAATTDLLPDRYSGPQPIGRGGMGEIFRATDTSLGRAVAIKVLDQRYAQDEGVRERFTREALAAARLSGNPNIVTIYDVGEWRERPFIVMEYLAGGSLEERLDREGAQPPARALEWLEQAATALDAAHREGVIHRDVKPANLLLDRHGPRARRRLRDRERRRARLADADRNRPRHRLGTSRPSRRRARARLRQAISIRSASSRSSC